MVFPRPLLGVCASSRGIVFHVCLRGQERCPARSPKVIPMPFMQAKKSRDSVMQVCENICPASLGVVFNRAR